MMSKHSFINKAIVRNTLTSNLIFGIFYMGILTIANIIPFYLALRDAATAKSDLSVGNAFYQQNSLYEAMPMELTLIILAAILVSFLVFKRLFKKDCILVLHSMPVEKGNIYRSVFISSWLLFIIPTLIDFSGMVLLALIYRPAHLSLILYYGALLIFLGSFIIFLMGFMAAFVGNSGMQFFLSISYLIIPISFIYLIHELMIIYVRGYNGIMNKLPLFQINLMSGIIVFLQMLLFFGIGNYVYKRRNNSSFQWVNREWFKRVIVLIFTLFSAYAFGALEVFHVLNEENPLNTLLSSFIGLIAGYLLSVFITRQTLLVYKYYKGFILCIILFYSSLFLILVGGNKYYTHIPMAKDIDHINFLVGEFVVGEFDLYTVIEPNDSPYFYNEAKFITEAFKNEYEHYYSHSLEKKENIENLRSFITDSIDKKNNTDLTNPIDFYVEYHLNNGKVVQRLYQEISEYSYPSLQSLDNSIANVYSSQEYLDKESPFNKYDQTLAVLIKLTDSIMNSSNVAILLSDPISIRNFFIKADVNPIEISWIDLIRDKEEHYILVDITYEKDGETFTSFAKIRGNIEDYKEFLQ